MLLQKMIFDKQKYKENSFNLFSVYYLKYFMQDLQLAKIQCLKTQMNRLLLLNERTNMRLVISLVI